MPLFLFCNFVNNLFIYFLNLFLTFHLFYLQVSIDCWKEIGACLRGNNSFHLIFILCIRPRSEFFVILLNFLSP